MRADARPLESGVERAGGSLDTGLRLALSAVMTTALLVLTGCTGISADRPAAHHASLSTPTSSPAPSAPPALPSVPVVSAGIDPASATDRPVRLQIPSKSIRMPVVPVGVLPNGGLQLPAHQSIAGWYRWGSTPTDGTGSTLIAAHVDTLLYGIGPFAQLRYLRQGAIILVTTSDGRTHDYAVQRVEYVGQHVLPLHQIFGVDGPARLTLVTCGGSYDSTTHQYSDNVLVFARPKAA